MEAKPLPKSQRVVLPLRFSTNKAEAPSEFHHHDSPAKQTAPVDPSISGQSEDSEQPQKTKKASKAPSIERGVSEATVNIMNAVIENRPYHEVFMREAIAMGEHALATDETPVGCVFVRKGEIIGRGMNDTNRSLNGTRHAEFVAIEEILRHYNVSILKETDLYVTVEPCIMCASVLRQFGIRSVYFGCANDKFGGTGGVMNIHNDWNIDPPYPVYGGIFREEAIMLLRRFYIQENGKGEDDPDPGPQHRGRKHRKNEFKLARLEARLKDPTFPKPPMRKKTRRSKKKKKKGQKRWYNSNGERGSRQSGGI